MALYLGGYKAKIRLDNRVWSLNINANENSVNYTINNPLLSSNRFLLKDKNGMYLTYQVCDSDTILYSINDELIVTADDYILATTEEGE